MKRLRLLTVATVSAVATTLLGAVTLSALKGVGVDAENLFGSPVDVADEPVEAPGQADPYRGGWGPSRTTYSMGSPSPTAAFNSIVDNPAYGDERNFVQCKLQTSAASEYADDVVIAGPVVLDVYVHIENASTRSPESDIQGATLQLVASEEPVVNSAVGVVLRGDDVTSVWDGCRLFAPEPLRVQYIPGSAVMETRRDGERVSIPLPDRVVHGSAPLPDVGHGEGVVPASTMRFGYIVLEVLVSPVEEP